jgi:hypothetical protein
VSAILSLRSFAQTNGLHGPLFPRPPLSLFFSNMLDTTTTTPIALFVDVLEAVLPSAAIRNCSPRCAFSSDKMQSQLCTQTARIARTACMRYTQHARERDRARQDLVCLARVLCAALQAKKKQLDEQVGRDDDGVASATAYSFTLDGISNDEDSGAPAAALSGDAMHSMLSTSVQLQDSFRAMDALASARVRDVASAAAALENRRRALQVEQQECVAELTSATAVVDDAESVHLRRLRAGDLLVELEQVRAALQKAAKAAIKARHQWERLNLQCVAPHPISCCLL